MPEIARFYGIIIQIYYGDHLPPHFHANYGEYSAKVDIQQLTVIDGALPRRALALTLEWASLHQHELHEAFRRAANMERPGKIDPLP